MKNYIGIYRQSEGNTFVIELSSAGPTLTLDRNSKVVLQKIEEHLYSVPNTEAKIRFVPSANGSIDVLEFIHNGSSSLALRVTTPQDSFAKLNANTLPFLLVFLSIVVAIVLILPPLGARLCTSGVNTGCLIAVFIPSPFLSMKDVKELGQLRTLQKGRTFLMKTQSDCDAGNTNACISVARELMLRGEKERAQAMLNQLCTQKNKLACRALTELLFKNGSPDLANREEVRQCVGGDWEVCYHLALKDLRSNRASEGELLLETVCRQTEELGCLELGDIEWGRGQKTKARAYFETACKKGIGNACHKLQPEYQQQSN
jgi:hypothetical protein